MNFLNDLSANTAVLSAVGLFLVWLLKGAMWALGEACKKLTTKLIETLAAVDVIKAQMTSILSMTTDVQKLKSDLDSAWQEIRKLKSANQQH